MARTTGQTFVNLPIRDVEETMAFYRALGFEFNMDFSDEKAACLVLNESTFLMLLTEPFFKTFTRKEVADFSAKTGHIVSLTFSSKEEVNQIYEAAVSNGAEKAMDPQGDDFMYYRSFYDPNGHLFEIMTMHAPS
ncbi:VOC family protein [Listeria costaricensis]|uniref:VOC family protein n=1 Tax=Listeria costaricensis TaxID=2026604 RepID=UPI000C076104|nr:VOC family protein [Listeria costaricensis]